MEFSSYKLSNSSEIRNKIMEIILKANKTIMSFYKENNLQVNFKEDDSPLTKADISAHKLIVQGLKELIPELPIVSEEDKKSHMVGKFTDKFWLIDPLDGTKEFIKGTEEFTCNVALIENNKSTYGFVGVPAKNQIYFGGKGFGSFKRDANGEISQINCQKHEDKIYVIASQSHLNNATKLFIDSIKEPYELIRAGSSLKFIKIAEGLAHLYPRMAPTSEWDTAAAHSVLEGAGGIVIQTNRENLIYGKENILNPSFIAMSDINLIPETVN